MWRRREIRVLDSVCDCFKGVVECGEVVEGVSEVLGGRGERRVEGGGGKGAGEDLDGIHYLLLIQGVERYRHFG